MTNHFSAAYEDCETSSLINLIKDRRTIRKFEEGNLPSALLYKLLQESAELTIGPDSETPFRFILAVTAEEKNLAASIIMKTYAELAIYKWVPGKIRGFMADRIEKIPAIGITVLKKGKDSEAYDQNFALTSAAVHNFSLLLWEQNIGMVWGTGDVLHYPSFTKGLQLQEDEEVHSMVYIGKYLKKPKAKARTEVAKKLTKLT